MNCSSTGAELGPADIEAFARDGYLVIRSFLDAARCRELDALVDAALDPPLAPVEYEADVHYPGAPAGKSSHGGYTPRRLLAAYSRDEAFRRFATDQRLASIMRTLIATPAVCLSQNHHNCVMTKYPGFSSLTNWHQDIRYWRFDRPELVSAWLALGPEHPGNGGLSLIPGSQHFDLGRGRLDAALFLRTDLEENRRLIDSAVPALLEAGDVLLFHCRTYHAAGRNTTGAVKKSLVFSYRARDNQPIPDTRSAAFRDIALNG